MPDRQGSVRALNKIDIQLPNESLRENGERTDPTINEIREYAMSYVKDVLLAQGVVMAEKRIAATDDSCKFENKRKTSDPWYRRLRTSLRKCGRRVFTCHKKRRQ
ncbi:uncharacterized protein LOC143241896 [Tachypleus tridentatus]|uniref:uncharacterized protein LOC143241894 n=1 Tax=Tachypleus tridentatus TaxID=6853 RepID=UPI003FD4193C